MIKESKLKALKVLKEEDLHEYTLAIENLVICHIFFREVRNLFEASKPNLPPLFCEQFDKLIPRFDLNELREQYLKAVTNPKEKERKIAYVDKNGRFFGYGIKRKKEVGI